MASCPCQRSPDTSCPWYEFSCGVPKLATMCRGTKCRGTNCRSFDFSPFPSSAKSNCLKMDSDLETWLNGKVFAGFIFFCSTRKKLFLQKVSMVLPISDLSESSLGSNLT